MVDGSPQPDELLESLKFAELQQRLRKTRRGLLRRAALFAGGANKVFLREVPTEEVYIAVTGTFVILTSIVAAFAAGFAASYLMYGGLRIHVGSVLFGLLWGAIIFTVDRGLVKAPLNPYRFTADELPPAESASDDIGSPMGGARGRRVKRGVVGVLSKAFLRFALALAASFFFAEILLIGLVYRTEVEARVITIHAQHVQAEVNKEKVSYAARKQELEAEIKAKLGASDQVLAGLQKQQADEQVLLQKLQADLNLYKRLRDAEYDGDKLTLQPSDQPVPITTTGKRGNGQAFTDRVNDVSRVSKTVTAAQSLLKGYTQATAKRIAKDRKDYAGSIASLQGSVNLLDASHQKFIATHDPNNPAPINGIAIRFEAMSDVERDKDPATPTVEAPVACSHGFVWIPCNTWRFFVQPTPQGPFAGSVRLILLAIELMPMILKVSFSLRRTRTYDALQAALEEIQEARAKNMMDSLLVQVLANRAGRGAWLRTIYIAAGAEQHLNMLDPELLGPARELNALEAELSDAFIRRRRMWAKIRRPLTLFAQKDRPPYPPEPPSPGVGPKLAEPSADARTAAPWDDARLFGPEVRSNGHEGVPGRLRRWRSALDRTPRP